METMSKITIYDLAYPVAAAVLYLLARALWNWRGPLAGQLGRGRDYVAALRSSAALTTEPAAIAATAPAAVAPVAMPRNEGNGELSGNVVLRARAEIIARLLGAGLYVADGKGGYKELRQTALITLATGLQPTGRADSDYARLRAELEPLINPQISIAAGRPEERQIAR